MQESLNSPRDPREAPDENIDKATVALEGFIGEASKKAHKAVEEAHGKRDSEAEKVAIELVKGTVNEKNREFEDRLRQSLFKVKFYELLAAECERRFESEADVELKDGYEKLAKQSRALVKSESANYKKIQEEWEKFYKDQAEDMEKGYDDLEKKMEEDFDKKRQKAREDGDVLLDYEHKL